MVTGQALLDIDAVNEEVFAYYDAAEQSEASFELCDAEVKGLLDLGSLLEEIKKHHPHNVEATIDLSFVDLLED